MRSTVKITTIIVYILGVVSYPLVESYFSDKAEAKPMVMPQFIDSK